MFELDWNSFLAGAASMGIMASFNSESNPTRRTLPVFVFFMVFMLFRFITDGYELGTLLLAILFGRFAWLAWKFPGRDSLRNL